MSRPAARRAIVAVLAALAVLLTGMPAASAGVNDRLSYTSATVTPRTYVGAHVDVSFTGMACNDETYSGSGSVTVSRGSTFRQATVTVRDGAGTTNVIVPATPGTYEVTVTPYSGACYLQTPRVVIATIEAMPRDTVTTITTTPATRGGTFTATATVSGAHGDISTAWDNHPRNANVSFYLDDVYVGGDWFTASSPGESSVSVPITAGNVDAHRLRAVMAKVNGPNGTEWLGSEATVTVPVAGDPVNVTATPLATSWTAGSTIVGQATVTDLEGEPVPLDDFLFLVRAEDGTTVGSVTGTASTLTFSVPTAELGAGTHTLSFVAVSIGAHSSGIGTFEVVVDRFTPSITLTVPDRVPFAEPFTGTVTLTGPPANGGFTGTVTVTDHATGDVLGQADVAADGTAEVELLSQQVGLRVLKVTYSGDARWAPVSNGTPLQVDPSIPTISMSVETLVAGVANSVEVQVSHPVVTPAGAAYVYVSGSFAGIAPLDADGRATIPIDPQAVGSRSLSVAYGPSSGAGFDSVLNYGWFTFTPATSTVEVDLVATPSDGLAGTVCIDYPDEIVVAPSALGGAFTVWVSRNGGASVAHHLPPTVLGDGCWGADLSGLGYGPGRYSVVGSHRLSAFLADATGGASITVKAPSAVTLSGPTEHTYGTPAEFTVTVSGDDHGMVRTGDVELLVDGDVAATAPLDPDGTATFAAALAGGERSVSARYAGNDDFHPASSSPSTITVKRAQLTATVSVSPSPPVAGEPATLRAAVTASTGSFASLLGALPLASVVTGTATFWVNGAAVGTAPIVAGVATLSYVFTSSGAHTIAVSFDGDANFAPIAATDAVAPVAVQRPPTPPAGPPVPPAGPPDPPTSPPAPPAGASAPSVPAFTTAAGDLAFTGSNSVLLTQVGAALLVGGIVAARRARRR